MMIIFASGFCRPTVPARQQIPTLQRDSSTNPAMQQAYT